MYEKIHTIVNDHNHSMKGITNYNVYVGLSDDSTKMVLVAFIVK